ncbi:hypothetical protein BTVI_07033 [Pitangus sulphuratus]|nr:hypothetical protein BTVI_07033 [Pitangus sulphuratus]
MFNTAQYPQEAEKVSKSDNEMTTGPVAAPAPGAGTGTETTETENQEVVVSVVLVPQQKKRTRKSSCKKASAKTVKKDKEIKEGREDEKKDHHKDEF